MIISDKYEYVFIQKPRSASSQMGLTLCEQYDGREILKKHSEYADFKDSFPDNNYKSFCFLRNPLDKLVTMYLRCRYPHKQHRNFSPRWLDNKTGWQMEIYEKELTFEQFCAMMSEWRVFEGFISNSPRHENSLEGIDFIGRYENIQEDWSKALSMFNIPQNGPLPSQDRTYGKKENFADHYTEATKPIITDYFSDLMASMGYNFPEGW